MLEPGYPRKRLAGQLTWSILWLTVTALGAFFLKPSAAGHGTHTQLGLPSCPTVLLFGRLCPGCGLTTSWTSLLHGDWAGSLHAHPFGPLLYLVFTLSAVLSMFGYATLCKFDTNKRWITVATGVFAVVFIGFGVWRFVYEPSPSPLARVASPRGTDRGEPPGVPKEDPPRKLPPFDEPE